MAARLGFVFLQLLPYLLGFLAVAGVVGTAYHTVKKSGYTEAQAELQPKIDACEASVKAQNDALAALKAAGDAKAARAAQALAGATQKARVWEDNAARLRAVLTAPRKAGEAVPTTCEAAWKEIRK